MKDIKLEKSEVMQHLREYNEKELFYQQYQKMQNDKEMLEKFLQHYDKDVLKFRQIYIKEFLPEVHKEFESEASMWLDPEKAIEINKYSRYMPRLPAVHDFFEIVYVLENDMSIDIEEKYVALQTGDICFIPPGMIHVPQIMENTIALEIIIRKSTFHKEFFKLLKGNNVISEFFLNALYMKKSNGVLIFHTEEDDEFKSILLHLYQENYNKCPCHKFVMNNLFEIALCFLQRYDQRGVEVKNVKPCADVRITQMLQYIQDNCEKVTIAEMANKFYLSKAYLSKYIIHKTGKSFSSILQEIKLEKACDMLRNSILRIEDISLSIGYQNVEHFIRLFKKKYNKTPNQYRVSE